MRSLGCGLGAGSVGAFCYFCGRPVYNCGMGKMVAQSAVDGKREEKTCCLRVPCSSCSVSLAFADRGAGGSFAVCNNGLDELRCSPSRSGSDMCMSCRRPQITTPGVCVSGRRLFYFVSISFSKRTRVLASMVPGVDRQNINIFATVCGVVGSGPIGVVSQLPRPFRNVSRRCFNVGARQGRVFGVLDNNNKCTRISVCGFGFQARGCVFDEVVSYS